MIEFRKTLAVDINNELKYTVKFIIDIGPIEICYWWINYKSTEEFINSGYSNEFINWKEGFINFLKVRIKKCKSQIEEVKHYIDKGEK